MKKIYLHIGSYKTGSTSIQRFLLDHVDRLREHGIAFYRGQFSNENHFELYVASLRYERDSFAKLGVCRHITFDAQFTKQIAERVQHFIRQCEEPCVVFSSEGLSLLRYEDEIERLKSVLGPESADPQVILYLRNKADFLRSYTSQLLKLKGRKPAQDPTSALYVEQDTWLTDYDSLVSTYQKAFGASNVIVVDYDEVMKREGNVIPSFLRALGIDAFREIDVASYFLNTSDKRDRRSPRKSWAQRVKLAWGKSHRRRAA
jgi:hypothetical protein